MSQNPSADKAQPAKEAEKDGNKIGSTATEGKKDEGQTKRLPQLGALEDDDEFEDFPASAEQSGNVQDALANSGETDHLWEDNWDDDDIEDDFTKQLRTAIQQRNGGDATMKE